MTRPRKTSIVRKHLLVFLPFLVLTIAITVVVISCTNYRFYRKSIRQNYGHIVNAAAGEINLYLENARKDIESLAWVLRASRKDAWQSEMILTAFQHAKPKFCTLSLINANGNEFHASPEEDGIRNPETDRIIGAAFGGEISFSGVTFNEVDLPVIHLAVPVKRLGKIETVLYGCLDLKYIWDVLTGITIGDTGSVYILDMSGRYVAHPAIDHVVKGLSEDRPEVLETIKLSSEPVEWIDEGPGESYLCLGVNIPDQEWMIVLSQSIPETYAFFYANLNIAVWLSVLICTFTGIVGWLMLRRLTQPIRTIHAQVQKIGQGDLEQKVTVQTGDEIGDLGEAMNVMSDSLKGYIEREVEIAKELAHAKNLAQLGALTSKVTHEMGNILNNTELTLYTLKQEGTSPTGIKALEILEKDAKRVRTFIKNFLQFSKKPEIHLEKVPIDKIFQEILFVQQPEAEKKGIRFEINCAPDLPPINCDQHLIYQALNNLIKNSLDIMHDPGTIRIEGQAESGHVQVKIQDTGPGIEPDTLPRIFEPFFSTKGKKGTGLGLSIVKTIIEAHRGTIECHSELNKGTTFVIHLPLK